MVKSEVATTVVKSEVATTVLMKPKGVAEKWIIITIAIAIAITIVIRVVILILDSAIFRPEVIYFCAD